MTPYIYHACGHKETLPDINTFHVFQTNKIDWYGMEVDVYIIGQSHFIQIQSNFLDLCACIPFQSSLKSKEISVQENIEYILPTYIDMELKAEIEIRGRAVAGMSELSSKENLFCFEHQFENDALTKIMFLFSPDQSTFYYKTLHTYVEYDRTLETEARITRF